jgi:hypothetical protein
MIREAILHFEETALSVLIVRLWESYEATAKESYTVGSLTEVNCSSDLYINLRGILPTV